MRKQLENELVNHGLWPKEAEAVMNELEADEVYKAMQGRWGEDATNYPSQLLTVMLIAAKQKAIDWIDRNKPRHFARGILSA